MGDIYVCIFKIFFVIWWDLESFIIYLGIKKFNIGFVYFIDGCRYYWDKFGVMGVGDLIYLFINVWDKFGVIL